MFFLILIIGSIIAGYVTEFFVKGWTESKIEKDGQPSLFWSCVAWPYFTLYILTNKKHKENGNS